MCLHQDKVLIDTIGNGWAPQSYASTSIGMTGPNYHHNLVDLNNLFPTKSYTHLKRNQKGNHGGPAVVIDSHIFCTSNHELSVKNIDLLSVKKH